MALSEGYWGQTEVSAVPDILELYGSLWYAI